MRRQGRQSHGDVPQRGAGVAPARDRSNQGEAHSDPSEVNREGTEAGGMQPCDAPCFHAAFDFGSIRDDHKKVSRTMRAKTESAANRVSASSS